MSLQYKAKERRKLGVLERWPERAQVPGGGRGGKGSFPDLGPLKGGYMNLALSRGSGPGDCRMVALFSPQTKHVYFPGECCWGPWHPLALCC